MPAIIWDLSFLSGRSLMHFWVDWWQLKLVWGQKDVNYVFSKFLA